MMKKLYVFLFSIFVSGACLAQTGNWNNSPSNWSNSPNNWSSTNGVYDNSGKRIGYETQSPQGVSNVFDNNGNRIGYVPAK